MADLALAFERAAQSTDPPAVAIAQGLTDRFGDPVCGMQVAESEAARQTEHEGKTYYFCSTSCQDKFERAPEDIPFIGKGVESKRWARRFFSVARSIWNMCDNTES